MPLEVIQQQSVCILQRATLQELRLALKIITVLYCQSDRARRLDAGVEAKFSRDGVLTLHLEE